MIVTRYLGSHLKETLATSELKAAKVSDFNDPFEFRFRHGGDYGRQQAMMDFQNRLNTPEFWQRIQDHPRFAGLSKDAIIQQLKDNQDSILDSLVAESPSGHKELVDEAHDNADATTRIICFSIPSDDPDDDMLRWSHYSKCHKGARIWIDLSKQEPPLKIGYTVRYSNSLVTIDNSRTGDNEYIIDKFRDSMSTKAECWGYEGEVRSFIPKPFYVSRKSCGEELDFVKLNLKGVVRIDFGVRFPPKEIPQIIKTYGTQLSESVKFYHAACSYDEYKIIYHEIKAEHGKLIRDAPYFMRTKWYQ